MEEPGILNHQRGNVPKPPREEIMLHKELQSKKKLSFGKIVDFIKENVDSCDDAFCLYTETWVEHLSGNLDCYIDAYPHGDENDEDVYPDFIVENDFDLIYYGEHFISVVKNVLHQHPKANTQNIIDALNYYRENDNFLDFKPV